MTTDDGAIPTAILDDTTEPLPLGFIHPTKVSNDLAPVSGEIEEKDE